MSLKTNILKFRIVSNVLGHILIWKKLFVSLSYKCTEGEKIPYPSCFGVKWKHPSKADLTLFFFYCSFLYDNLTEICEAWNFIGRINLLQEVEDIGKLSWETALFTELSLLSPEYSSTNMNYADKQWRDNRRKICYAGGPCIDWQIMACNYSVCVKHFRIPPHSPKQKTVLFLL